MSDLEVGERVLFSEHGTPLAEQSFGEECEVIRREAARCLVRFGDGEEFWVEATELVRPGEVRRHPSLGLGQQGLFSA